MAANFRYRDPIIDSKTLTVALANQAKLRIPSRLSVKRKSKGSPSLAICNVFAP